MLIWNLDFVRIFHIWRTQLSTPWVTALPSSFLWPWPLVDLMMQLQQPWRVSLTANWNSMLLACLLSLRPVLQTKPSRWRWSESNPKMHSKRKKYWGAVWLCPKPSQDTAKSLTMPLCTPYYNQIKDGHKKVEIRAACPYWESRIRHITHIVFQLGALVCNPKCLEARG